MIREPVFKYFDTNEEIKVGDYITFEVSDDFDDGGGNTYNGQVCPVIVVSKVLTVTDGYIYYKRISGKTHMFTYHSRAHSATKQISYEEYIQYKLEN